MRLARPLAMQLRYLALALRAGRIAESARDRARILRFAGSAPLLLHARNRPPRPLRFRLTGGFPVTIRDRSELEAMREVLLEGQYAQVRGRPRVILDCGANVGFASLYFHRRFPEARIVAVEADPRTVERLRENLAGIPNVEVVHRAVAGEEGELVLHSSANSASSSLTPRSGASAVAVPASTIGGLLDELGIDRLDLLKLDVEGAEFDALGATPLDRVDQIVAEVHFDLGESTEDELRALLRGFDVRLERVPQPERRLMSAIRSEAGG